MSFSQASQANKPVLQVAAHDIRHIASVIRGVSFGHTQRATLTIQEAGLTFTVEEARSVLVSAYLNSSDFEHFAFHAPRNVTNDPFGATASDKVSFDVELNALLTCLDIFGTAGGTSMLATGDGSGGERGDRGRFGGGGRGRWGGRFRRDRDDENEAFEDNANSSGFARLFGGSSNAKATGMRMTYEGSGYPLTLILSEEASGPVTTCDIVTMISEPNLEIAFEDSEKIIYIILKSSWMLEALSELDPSCERVSFLCSPPNVPLPVTSAPGDIQAWLRGQDPPTVSTSTIRRGLDFSSTFRLLGTGDFGTTEMDYPNDREVLETFQCESPVMFTYRFSHIARTLRAVQGSSKTSIRMNEEGVLSLQFMMPPIKVGGKSAIIEFRCMPLNEEEDIWARAIKSSVVTRKTARDNS